MKEYKNKTRKLFLTFVLFSIILSVFTISIEKTFFNNHAKKLAIKNGLGRIQEKEKTFNEFLKNVEYSLKYLKENKTFTNYIKNQKESKNTTQLFYSFIKINPLIKELRFIDKTGLEKINIKRTKEYHDPYITKSKNLKSIPKDEYFLKNKQISIFAITNEKKKQNHTRTLKAIVPIINNKKFSGVLEINYFMDNFLEKLSKTPFYDMSLINDQGEYIIDFHSNITYNEHNFIKEFPTYHKDILNNAIYQNDTLISKSLNLNIDGGLRIILKLKKEYLAELSSSETKRQITYSATIFFSALILSLFIVKYFSRTLLNYEELVNLNQKLNNASKIAKIGFWEYFAKTDKMVCNGGVFNILEIDDPKQEINRKYSFSFFLDEDINEIEKIYEQSIINHNKFFISKKIKTKKANLKQVEVRAKHIYNNKDIYIKSIGSIIDVTDEYTKQKEIDTANMRLQLAIDGTKDGVWDWNIKTNKVNYSSRWKSMLGYKENEISNEVQEWISRVHPDDLPLAMEKMDLHFKKKSEVYEAIIRIKHKNGQWIWIIDRGKVELDKDGNPYRMIGFQTDITKQKNLEETLKEEKEKFESIYKYSKDGIAIVDLQSNFLEFNNAFLDMIEYTKEELLKESCHSLSPEEEQEKDRDAFNMALKQGYITNYEKTCITKTKKKIKINISASLLPDKKSFLIFIKDMTILKLLDEQSKLAVMGEMIGNIAHQWRQPLSVISTSASSLKFKIEFDDEIDNEFITYSSDMIVAQTQYLSKTIDDFRNFVKGDTSIKELSIKDVINSTFTLLEATINNNYIELEKDIEDDLIILGNKNELQQAMINIINNAKDAMKDNAKDSNRFLFISTKKLDNNTLELKIKDSGGGIKEDIMDRLFEPYFTTKDKDTGTGIGLAMVDKIITERHNAHIKVSNETYIFNDTKYKGACFSISFKAE